MTGGRPTPNLNPAPRIVGLCTGRTDVDWFAVDQEGKTAAKAICAECPSTLPCYATAAANNEMFGVWGGVDFSLPRRALGLPGRPPPQCGTDTGYKSHNRKGELPCQPCRAAHYEAHKRYRLARRQPR